MLFVFIYFLKQIFLGASHADDTLLVLPMMDDPLNSETDDEMSKILLDMWLSFAKNGYLNNLECCIN